MNSPSNSRPDIQFLNKETWISKTLNRLPHWQQREKAYFITFRLADSIPTTLLTDWKRERQNWLSDHPAPWTAEIEAEYHRRFSLVVDRYLDQGLGNCILQEIDNRNIVSQTFRYFDNSKYLLHAFVIMPNHVHLLLSPHPNVGVNQLVASWKRYSAKEINRLNHADGRIWQKDYFDRLIRDWDHFMNVCRYIRNNPLKAKLANHCYELYLTPWVVRLLS